MNTMNSSWMIRGMRSGLAAASSLFGGVKLAWLMASRAEMQMARISCVLNGVSVPSRKRVVAVAIRLLYREIVDGRKFNEIEADVGDRESKKE